MDQTMGGFSSAWLASCWPGWRCIRADKEPVATRNLSPAWLIELELGSKADLLEIGKAKMGDSRRNEALSQNDKPSPAPVNTRESIAKAAGVSTGQVGMAAIAEGVEKERREKQAEAQSATHKMLDNTPRASGLSDKKLSDSHHANTTPTKAAELFNTNPATYHPGVFRILAALLLSVSPIMAEPTTPDAIAKEIIGPLVNPAKVDTLKGDRPINARTYRLLFWLETARRAGGDVSGILETAQREAGYHGTPRARADALAIIENREKMDALGCFDAPGMAELRKGNSPTITKGSETGREVHLDHRIPIHIAPELAARFYDLAVMSDRQNTAKGAKITRQELDLALRWQREGLLSDEGLAAVERAME